MGVFAKTFSLDSFVTFKIFAKNKQWAKRQKSAQSGHTGLHESSVYTCIVCAQLLKDEIKVSKQKKHFKRKTKSTTCYLLLLTNML
jgi:hypothetical protein